MKSFLNNFTDINKDIYNIMDYGVRFSIFLCITGIFLLLIYKSYYISYNLFPISLSIFQSGITFLIQFILCGLVINMIKK